jgi:hypothetical protein
MLYICSDVHRLEFGQVGDFALLTPAEKQPRCPTVCSPSVRILDIDREKFDEAQGRSLSGSTDERRHDEVRGVQDEGREGSDFHPATLR